MLCIIPEKFITIHFSPQGPPRNPTGSKETISSRFSGLTVYYTSLHKNSVFLTFLYKFILYKELPLLFAAVMHNIGI